jgi:hypothetical protein
MHAAINRKEKIIVRFKTLRLLSSLPARARISVLFPEEGGPRRRVILKTQVTQQVDLISLCA